MPCSKYTEEEVLLAADFGLEDELALFGESLNSILSITFSPADAALQINTRAAAAISGTQVQFWVKGGTPFSTYTFTVLAMTSANKTIASKPILNMLD